MANGMESKLEFERQSDKSVRVTITAGSEVVTTVSVVLTEDMWAGVVAGVSKSGNTPVAKDIALEYHNTDFADYEKEDGAGKEKA